MVHVSEYIKMCIAMPNKIKITRSWLLRLIFTAKKTTVIHHEVIENSEIRTLHFNCPFERLYPT